MNYGHISEVLLTSYATGSSCQSEKVIILLDCTRSADRHLTRMDDEGQGLDHQMGNCIRMTAVCHPIKHLKAIRL